MPYLTAPLNAGGLKLHNRLVMPPMATARADKDGHVTDALLDYYDEKSRGGCFSLVITEHSYISPQGKARDRQLSIAGDSAFEGLRKLASVIHANACRAAVQINHGGSAPADGVGPSAVPHPNTGTVPAVLTEPQIQEIIRDFRDAAQRAKQAGFDAVEIHSAHGYLLNQFYSPLTNKREDAYGGSLRNRIRIHLEVIRAIREAVGAGYPILLRLGGCDYMEGGSTIDDCVAACREFEKAGVDILDISGGFCRYVHPHSTQAGYFSDISLPVKQAVSIPVILTGGVLTGWEAEDLLARGAADLIGVGRALLNDSGWAAKALGSLEQGDVT